MNKPYENRYDTKQELQPTDAAGEEIKIPNIMHQKESVRKVLVVGDTMPLATLKEHAKDRGIILVENKREDIGE
jgi:hypothetical protein